MDLQSVARQEDIKLSIKRTKEETIIYAEMLIRMAIRDKYKIIIDHFVDCILKNIYEQFKLLEVNYDKVKNAGLLEAFYELSKKQDFISIKYKKNVLTADKIVIYMSIKKIILSEEWEDLKDDKYDINECKVIFPILPYENELFDYKNMVKVDDYNKSLLKKNLDMHDKMLIKGYLEVMKEIRKNYKKITAQVYDSRHNYDAADIYKAEIVCEQNELLAVAIHEISIQMMQPTSNYHVSSFQIFCATAVKNKIKFNVNFDKWDNPICSNWFQFKFTDPNGDFYYHEDNLIDYIYYVANKKNNDRLFNVDQKAIVDLISSNLSDEDKIKQIYEQKQVKLFDWDLYDKLVVEKVIRENKFDYDIFINAESVYAKHLLIPSKRAMEREAKIKNGYKNEIIKYVNQLLKSETTKDFLCSSGVCLCYLEGTVQYYGKEVFSELINKPKLFQGFILKFNAVGEIVLTFEYSKDEVDKFV